MEADQKLKRIAQFPLELLDFYMLELGLIEDPPGMPHRWQTDMVEIYLVKQRIQIERMFEHKTVCPWLTQA